MLLGNSIYSLEWCEMEVCVMEKITDFSHYVLINICDRIFSVKIFSHSFKSIIITITLQVTTHFLIFFFIALDIKHFKDEITINF